MDFRPPDRPAPRIVLTESDELPVTAELPADSFFATNAWWRATLAAALPPGAQPCFVTVTLDGRPTAAYPMLRLGRSWQGLTTLYTYRYAPLLAEGPSAPASTIAHAAFGRWLRGRGVVRLDALDPEDPGYDSLLCGLRDAGLIPLPFAHFVTWEEDVAGCDWATYLARRGGRLRGTLRRRLRDAEADPAVSVALLHTPAEIAAGIAAYDTVAARSWKPPEPFPAFNATLFREAAAEGVLFMAVLRRGGQPIAVQAWAHHRGRATVLKLVHDAAEAARSPGTVLTALVIRHLLRDRRLAWLDFGRGDDAYKRDWAGTRRQRVGLLIADPWRPAGLAAILRHRLGQLRRRLMARPAG